LPGGKREWEFYSTDANAFLEIGSFVRARCGPRVLTLAASNAPVAALPGRLYAVGGRIDDNYSRKLASDEADDPPTNRWDQRAPLPTARSGIAAAVLEGQMFVFGGEGPAGTRPAWRS
jgi:hypothetical protein